MPRPVQNGENLNRFALHPVGGQQRCAGDHQLARASYAAEAAHLRILHKLPDSCCHRQQLTVRSRRVGLLQKFVGGCKLFRSLARPDKAHPSERFLPARPAFHHANHLRVVHHLARIRLANAFFDQLAMVLLQRKKLRHCFVEQEAAVSLLQPGRSIERGELFLGNPEGDGLERHAISIQCNTEEYSAMRHHSRYPIPMRPLDYIVCDVFTSTPLAGNQLAVFPDAGHLTPAQMQAIARETNHSETTFLCRRDAATEAGRGYRVRIFTVEEELPFAGHPTLGTAAVIRRFVAQEPSLAALTLDLNAGLVPVVFDDAQASGPIPASAVYGEMTQPKAELGAVQSREVTAPALGLSVDDLSPAWAPQIASTGNPFCIVPLRSVEALTRLRLRPDLAPELLHASGARFFYAIAQEAPGQWQARMQFYNGEDPATGSAAGCAMVYLVGNGIEPPDARIHLRQGLAIHRPSDLYGRASLQNGKPAQVRVAGCTVFVAKGQLFLEQFT